MEMEEKLFYTINEVAQMLNVNPSLLRYWETEFSMLKPYKNKKGTRRYTQGDIELLRRIYYLTKECGFTLDGAREQLKRGGGTGDKMQVIRSLHEVRDFLVQLKEEM